MKLFSFLYRAKKMFQTVEIAILYRLKKMSDDTKPWFFHFLQKKTGYPIPTKLFSLS